MPGSCRDDVDYDAARALYNGMIDKRPRLIARYVDIADGITAVHFVREQGLLLALFDPFFPKGLQWYWKGDFVKALPDEAIDIHIAQAATAPSELSLMHLDPIVGAVRRVAKDATMPAWPWSRPSTIRRICSG
jgi:hypothetical protein